MQFGESLARLAADIATGYGARQVSAGARTAALASRRAATRQTLSANTAHRMAVARDLAAGAAAQRQRLAAADAALGAAVQRGLAAARQDLAVKREVIAANAKALRIDLDVSRRDTAAAAAAFRAETRSEQAAAAAALAASLGQFVAGVRSETAQIQRAVRDQVLLARTAWGTAAAPAPAVNKTAAARAEHEDGPGASGPSGGVG